MANVTIDHSEAHGSPTETWAEDGTMRATRILECEWSQRRKLMRQLLGFTGGVYTLPATYPGVNSSRVKNVAIENDGAVITNSGNAITTLNAYQKARLRVDYETYKLGVTDDDDGVIMEESLQPSAKALTVAGQAYFWTDEDENGDSTMIPAGNAESPQLLLGQVEWHVTLYNVQSLPSGFGLVNRVNDAAILSNTLGITFPAETLLYAGGTPSRQFDEDGNATAWKLALLFIAQEYSWNRFWRSGFNEPQILYLSNGNAFNPFPLVNFNTTLNVLYN